VRINKGVSRMNEKVNQLMQDMFESKVALPNTEPAIMDYETKHQNELKEKLGHLKTACDKDGNIITDRVKYLESLPRDEYNQPIVDRDEFDRMACTFGWDYDWLDEAVSMGVIEAYQFDEFYSLDY